MEIFEKIFGWFASNKDGLIALSAFIAAGSSVFAAYITSRSAHRSRISGLRERWIEKLREEISSLTEVRVIFLLDKDGEVISASRRAHVIFNRIKLRVNIKEKKHSDLINAIDYYLKSAEEKEFGQRESLVIEKARIVIREEWKKAAKGKI